MSDIKRQILSFLFAFLCLLSSAQVVLNYHFCSEELVCTSINELNDSCCMPADHQADHNKMDCSDSGCCDDLNLVKSTEEFKSNKSEFNLKFNELGQLAAHNLNSISNSFAFRADEIKIWYYPTFNFQKEFCIYRI